MKLRERISNAIDTVIGFVSPRTVLERKAARAATEQFGQAYHGARSTRLNNAWDISSGSADYDLLPDLPTLRERSRELARNDATAASCIKTFTDNIVGNGIKAQSIIDAELLGASPEETHRIRKQCERAWNRWTQNADIARRFNFHDLQSQIMRSIILNGEAFILPVRVNRKSSPYSYALEIIEPDRIEYPGELDNPNGRTNRRSGIELGKYGHPVSYWVRVSHPGDGIYERATDRKHRRINALDQDGNPALLHLANHTRPGQTRGEPMLAPALQAFKDLGLFQESTIISARVASCFSCFISKDDPYTSALNQSDDTLFDRRIQELEPGMISYLGNGESITFANPGNHAAGYDPFVTRQLRIIGSALGIPYELVSKDFSQTNFSSARAALLEARRTFNQWQQYLITHFCKPVYAAVIEEAWMRGEIDIRDFDSVREALIASHWVTPSYGWVDPLKEVQASALAIESGISSVAIEAAGLGRDWEEVMEQQAREAQKRQELNIAPQDDQEESE